MDEKIEVEKQENANPVVEEEQDKEDEIKMKLAFPQAAIVRLMKHHMDKEKMIKRDVKIAMNRWLEKMCTRVAREMNKFPYVMMNLHEFKESIRVYEDLENFDKEKMRILAHMDAIKRDIQRLERDLGKVEEEVHELT
jgi:hypothetical protein